MRDLGCCGEASGGSLGPHWGSRDPVALSGLSPHLPHHWAPHSLRGAACRERPAPSGTVTADGQWLRDVEEGGDQGGDFSRPPHKRQDSYHVASVGSRNQRPRRVLPDPHYVLPVLPSSSSRDPVLFSLRGSMAGLWAAVTLLVSQQPVHLRRRTEPEGADKRGSLLRSLHHRALPAGLP